MQVEREQAAGPCRHLCDLEEDPDPWIAHLRGEGVALLVIACNHQHLWGIVDVHGAARGDDCQLRDGRNGHIASDLLPRSCGGGAWEDGECVRVGEKKRD